MCLRVSIRFAFRKTQVFGTAQVPSGVVMSHTVVTETDNSYSYAADPRIMNPVLSVVVSFVFERRPRVASVAA